MADEGKRQQLKGSKHRPSGRHTAGKRQAKGSKRHQLQGGRQRAERQDVADQGQRAKTRPYLVSSPEDGGLLGPPVIGVLVRILFPLQQCTSFCQSFYDGVIALSLHLQVHTAHTACQLLGLCPARFRDRLHRVQAFEAYDLSSSCGVSLILFHAL